MKQVRITVQCQANQDHSKILRLGTIEPEDEGKLLRYAKDIAAILDGSSKYYIFPPGAGSPIGKCVRCWGTFRVIVEEVEERDAKSKRKQRAA